MCECLGARRIRPLAAALAASILSGISAGAQTWAGSYTDPTGVVISWRPVGSNDGVIIRVANPTAAALRVQFHSRDVSITSMPTFGGLPEETDWDQGIIPPNSTIDEWYSVRMIMPRTVTAATISEPATADEFSEALSIIGRAYGPLRSMRRDDTGRTEYEYIANAAASLEKWLRNGPLSANQRASLEAARESVVRFKRGYIEEVRPYARTPEQQQELAGYEEEVRKLSELTFASAGRVGRSAAGAPTRARSQGAGTGPGVNCIEFSRGGESGACKEPPSKVATAATRGTQADKVGTTAPPTNQRNDGVPARQLENGRPDVPARRETEESKYARDASAALAEIMGSGNAEWLAFRENFSSKAEGTAEWLFSRAVRRRIQSNLSTGARAVAEAAIPDVAPLDRGSALRARVRSNAASFMLDYLHDGMVTAGARTTGDPVGDQIARVVSSAQVYNRIFGPLRSSYKMLEESGLMLDAAIGFITEREP